MGKIIFQPDLHRAYKHGIRQMVDAIRPTLGPIPQYVAIERPLQGQLPEILDNGAVIARRIVELSHRTENSGAMFVRHLLWQVHETVGDGTATAAIIFETIFNEGVRYLASGGNAMQLRQHLTCGAELIRQELTQMTRHIQDGQLFCHVAETISNDEELSGVLGEIFDTVGEMGRIDVRSGRSRGIEVRYVDGVYWRSGVQSKAMIRDKMSNRRHLKNAAVFVSDLDIKDPHDLIPLMSLSIKNGFDGLIIVADTVADPINNLIIQNEKVGKFDIVAVRVPGSKRIEQAENLQDLALLTGARPLLKATGDTLQNIKLDDLGHTRRGWANKDHFGIAGGSGDPHALRELIEDLTRRYQQSDDSEIRNSLQSRIGRLLGGSAILYVGGTTEHDGKTRRELAERTVTAMRGILRDGVVPGGGVALRNCREAIAHLQPDNPDERAAYAMLCTALNAPIRQILENAGYEPSTILADLRDGDEGFDVIQGKPVDVLSAGILDSAAVVKMAVYTAITTAALALTTDVLIQQTTPPQAIDP